jgi:hypothetical protein
MTFKASVFLFTSVRVNNDLQTFPFPQYRLAVLASKRELGHAIPAGYPVCTRVRMSKCSLRVGCRTAKTGSMDGLSEFLVATEKDKRN